MAFTARNYETKKRVRAERKAQGLCIYCGKVPDHQHKWGKRKASSQRTALRPLMGRVVGDSKGRRAAATRLWLSEYRVEMGCKKCGESHPACLEFHHRDEATKEYDFAAAVSKSREKLLVEIAKCDVLCSNCHKKHHYETKTGPWRRRS